MFSRKIHRICQGYNGELICVHVHMLCCACPSVCRCVHVLVCVCVCAGFYLRGGGLGMVPPQNKNMQA